MDKKSATFRTNVRITHIFCTLKLTFPTLPKMRNVRKNTTLSSTPKILHPMGGGCISCKRKIRLRSDFSYVCVRGRVRRKP